MKDKEFSVQDLCSDSARRTILTLSVIIAGLLIMILLFGLMFLAALFT